MVVRKELLSGELKEMMEYTEGEEEDKKKEEKKEK